MAKSYNGYRESLYYCWCVPPVLDYSSVWKPRQSKMFWRGNATCPCRYSTYCRLRQKTFEGPRKVQYATTINSVTVGSPRLIFQAEYLRFSHQSARTHAGAMDCFASGTGDLPPKRSQVKCWNTMHLCMLTVVPAIPWTQRGSMTRSPAGFRPGSCNGAAAMAIARAKRTPERHIAGKSVRDTCTCHKYVHTRGGVLSRWPGPTLSSMPAKNRFCGDFEQGTVRVGIQNREVVVILWGLPRCSVSPHRLFYARDKPAVGVPAICILAAIGFSWHGIHVSNACTQGPLFLGAPTEGESQQWYVNRRMTGRGLASSSRVRTLVRSNHTPTP